jgi:hypothetical protein
MIDCKEFNGIRIGYNEMVLTTTNNDADHDNIDKANYDEQITIRVTIRFSIKTDHNIPRIKIRHINKLQ